MQPHQLLSMQASGASQWPLPQLPQPAGAEPMLQCMLAMPMGVAPPTTLPLQLSCQLPPEVTQDALSRNMVFDATTHHVVVANDVAVKVIVL